MQITKGERIVAEALGDIPQTGMPVLTKEHPFLRKTIAYMQTRKEWLGTATDLLNAVGDNYTPPNTITKLLRKNDYQYLTGKKELKYHSAVSTAKDQQGHSERAEIS